MFLNTMQCALSITQFSEADLFQCTAYRLSKKFAIIWGTVHCCFVVSLFSFVFPGCLTRRVINAAMIVLFKSTIDWQVDVR